MDIAKGLAAASHAVASVQKLRELEEDFDRVAFRAEIANLMLAISDTKIALVDARLVLQQKDVEIKRLKLFRRKMTKVNG